MAPTGSNVDSATADALALAIVKSEAFMWLMAGSAHADIQLAIVREMYRRYRDAGGKTWGQR